MVLFKTLPIVRAVVRPEGLPQKAEAYHRDTATLGWEERIRTRGRRRTDHDYEFGSALPRGTILKEGDCLVLDEAQLVVSVIELAEPVFLIEPPTPHHWGLYAYAIGNSHQPLMLTGDTIVCPDILGMVQVLDYHKIPYRRETRPFTPTGADGGLYAPGHLHHPATER